MILLALMLQTLTADPHLIRASRMEWQVERLEEQVRKLEDHNAADTELERRLLRLELKVEELPTLREIIELLIALGVIGGAAGGGYKAYKNRRSP